MTGSPIDIILFAPLAPIFSVLLFWFFQLLFIEYQKYLLSSIETKHEPLCRFTNFLGILFQTICHALGYTVTKSGISQFYISVDYGKVSPKKEKKGLFEWLANVFLFVGPFFIPPFLLLFCLFFLLDDGLSFAAQTQYTFSENLILFGTNLQHFSNAFFGFLATIDLLHPSHLGFFLLMIVLGLGIRPSYIGETKKEKVNMFYDLKNIRYNVLHKPLYIFVLILFCYMLSYITVLFQMNFYVSLFSLFGWVSIIAITSLFIAQLLLHLIKITDTFEGYVVLIPYLTLIISYVLARVLFFFFPNPFANSLSLLIMILLTCGITLLLMQMKNNIFKSEFIMKSRKKKQKDGKDGPRRSLRKRTN